MTINYTIADAEFDLRELRKEVLRLAIEKREGHIGSSFSILHLLYHIYAVEMSQEDTNHKNCFILSKGHASLGLYVVLNHFSLITKKELDSFCDFDSKLGGHPHAKKIGAVSASTGSLGHGFPIAVGVAMANKIKGHQGQVFCLIGDGEANEGTVWEAALLAAEHKLDNLTCIMDMNLSGERALHLRNPFLKFQSFGFQSYEIDGHNLLEISNVLDKKEKNEMPKFVLANTIKGKGVKRMEGNPAWHHRSPNNEEYIEIIKEIDQV